MDALSVASSVLIRKLAARTWTWSNQWWSRTSILFITEEYAILLGTLQKLYNLTATVERFLRVCGIIHWTRCLLSSKTKSGKIFVRLWQRLSLLESWNMWAKLCWRTEFQTWFDNFFKMTKKIMEISDNVLELLDELVKNDQLLDTKGWTNYLLTFARMWNTNFVLLEPKKRVFGGFTIDVISSCCFGIQTNAIKDKNSEFVKHLQALFPDNLFSRPIIILICKLYFCILYVYPIFIFFRLILFDSKVLFPKLMAFFTSRKYLSAFPKESVEFFTNVSNSIIAKRKQVKDSHVSLRSGVYDKLYDVLAIKLKSRNFQ